MWQNFLDQREAEDSNCVRALRREKLCSPSLLGSAGSLCWESGGLLFFSLKPKGVRLNVWRKDNLRREAGVLGRGEYASSRDRRCVQTRRQLSTCDSEVQKTHAVTMICQVILSERWGHHLFPLVPCSLWRLLKGSWIFIFRFHKKEPWRWMEEKDINIWPSKRNPHLWKYDGSIYEDWG